MVSSSKIEQQFSAEIVSYACALVCSWYTAVGTLRVNVLSIRFNGFIARLSDEMAEDILHLHLFISFDVIFICLLSGNNVSLVRYCEREVMQRFYSSLHGTSTYETSNHITTIFGELFNPLIGKPFNSLYEYTVLFRNT